jgi:tRNA threonylcarbamoyladenosine biosynthesis protein TsaB
MKILALEFSSEERSVAVIGHGASTEPVVCTNRSHPRSLNAFGLIEKVLAKGGVELEEIDRLVVGIGPGSYTGIRAAISISQGWVLAREVKVMAIRSVEAVAARAQAERIFGPVHVAIDAQRGEFYLASYRLTAAEIYPLEPLRVASFKEVEALSKSGALLVGPEMDRWFAGARVFFPDAGMLAMLATGRDDCISAEELEPIYLRETNFVKVTRKEGGPTA